MSREMTRGCRCDSFRPGMRPTFNGLLMILLASWASAADQGAARPSVACLGQIVPGERVIRVAAPETALVKELKVRRGDVVSAGAVLAVLRDYDVAQAALARADRNVDLARARLEEVKAGERGEVVAAQEALVKARQAEAAFVATRKNRYQEMYESHLIPSDQYDEVCQLLAIAEAGVRRELNVLEGYRAGRKEDVAIAERSLGVAQAEREQAAAALETELVRAPLSGEVLEIHTYAGERAGAQGLLDLGDTAHMMVRAEVYETDIARVHKGDRATIRAQMAGQAIGGEVVEIERQVSASTIYPLDSTDYTDRRVIIVHIRPDQGAALAPHNNAQVTVTISAP
jgi:HlyD family secretion protein